MRTPGITDVVTHEQHALLADPGDLHMVVSYVAHLAEDRAGAVALGRRGLDLVRERHTWQRNAERTAAILESVIRARTPVVSLEPPMNVETGG